MSYVGHEMPDPDFYATKEDEVHLGNSSSDTTDSEASTNSKGVTGKKKKYRKRSKSDDDGSKPKTSGKKGSKSEDEASKSKKKDKKGSKSDDEGSNSKKKDKKGSKSDDEGEKTKKDKKKKKDKKGSDSDPEREHKEKKKNRLQRLAEDLDYLERDPSNINDFCSTQFDEVIGEPAGLHSDDRVWVTVYKAFFAGKICCGSCLQYICAVPCSFFWGCCFSMLAFMQVYNITPCIRAFNMIFSCFSRVYATVVMCFCVPVYESCALLFTKIYITRIDGATGYRKQNLDDLNMMKNNRGLEYDAGKMA